MKVRFFTIVILFIVMGSPGFSQDRPAHELHSMMIYNFLKYIEWPAAQNNGDFLIAVIGADDVYNTLNTWYGNKTRGNKTFKIIKASPDDDLTSYQLVYLGKGGSNSLESVLGKVGNKPVLTVTAERGLGEKGSCINFKLVNNRLKFELNQAAIEKTSLKTSSQLSAMAILI